VTVEAHPQQSAHLIGTLKISMACWMVAEEGATRRKIQAARSHGIPTVAGGGPFETAVAQRDFRGTSTSALRSASRESSVVKVSPT
jgi:hypothetical protein